jgi:hypothetical protein
MREGILINKLLANIPHPPNIPGPPNIPHPSNIPGPPNIPGSSNIHHPPKLHCELKFQYYLHHIPFKTT